MARGGHIHGFEYVYMDKHVTAFTLELAVPRSYSAYKQRGNFLPCETDLSSESGTKADLD